MSTRTKRSKSLPFVLVNMAMTADGKIATANRSISTFGSQRDHDHLLELRSTVDAVMCGSHTAATPGVNMGPGPAKYRRRRLARGLNEYNLRVIVSGSGRMPPNADVLKHTFSPVVLLTSRDADQQRLRRLEAAGCVVRAFGGMKALSQGAHSTFQNSKVPPHPAGRHPLPHSQWGIGQGEGAQMSHRPAVDLKAALRWLKRAHGVDRLLCEGGADLNDAMFRAGLVNEVHLTVCPFVFGGRTAPTIAEGGGFQKLAKCPQLQLESMKRRGDELFLVYSCLPLRP